MCFTTTMAIPLNPEAAPWAPSDAYLPHQIYSNSSQTLIMTPPPPPPPPPHMMTMQPLPEVVEMGYTLLPQQSSVLHHYTPCSVPCGYYYNINTSSYIFHLVHPQQQQCGLPFPPLHWSYSSCGAETPSALGNKNGFRLSKKVVDMTSAAAASRQKRFNKRYYCSRVPPPPPRFRKPSGDDYKGKAMWKPVKTKSEDDGKIAANDIAPGVGIVHVVVDVEGQVSLPPAEERTTVMIKNIPNQMRREHLLEFLDSYCRSHHLEYDFVYLPMDFGRHNNLGYAFVNFTETSAALRIMELLNDYRWSSIPSPAGVKVSKKICQVTWARIQGKEELKRKFERSNFVCDTEEYLPVELTPPRNGSSSLTTPTTVGKLRARYQ